MRFSQSVPNFLLELRENQYNLQYIVGDKIEFLFNEDTVYLSGSVIKKYTNSCLVDISQTLVLTKKEVEGYNGKVVVNYKKIKGVGYYERTQF